jgi:HK97 family phage portal protein
VNLPAILRTPVAMWRKATAPDNLSSVYSPAVAWLYGMVREAFPGAWQKGVLVETKQNLLTFSAVFACVSLIAGDIAKMRLKLMQRFDPGYWTEVTNSPTFTRVLVRPNRYQTSIQFVEAWVISLMLHGNAYVYRERDARGAVSALYVLDAPSVVPLVAPDGSIYYRIKRNYLAGVQGEEVTVPDSEVVHDRINCLFHPLVGVSPIYAAATSGTQGLRIQSNSAHFFENMSQPSGHLTAPAAIDDKTAERIKKDFETNFRGAGGLGRLLVTGQNIKYEAMTIPAADAQLIEQLKWTVEDVARCFKVPLHKISTTMAPSYNNIAALNQDYFSQCLQLIITNIEELLDAALSLGPAYSNSAATAAYGVEFDIDALVRMDPTARAEAWQKLVTAGIMAPNEARLRENLAPKTGGDTPFMQQQMWPLDKLAQRAPPPATPTLPAPGDAGPSDGTPPGDGAPPPSDGAPPALPPPRAAPVHLIEYKPADKLAALETAAVVEALCFRSEPALELWP